MSPKRLETQTTVSSYDVIIVLGAAVWQGGRPSPTLRRRVLWAVELFHQKEGRRLLFTGGLGRYPPSEARMMRQIATEAGVPRSDTLLEEQATSTFTSAVYCHRIMRQHGWTSALVVTDRYHLPRAQLTFCLLAGRSGMTISGRAVTARRRSRRWKRRLWAHGREGVALGWYLLKILSWKINQRFRGKRHDTP